MKTVKVISEFVDKFNPAKHYVVGEIAEFNDERAADMVARRLADYVEQPKKEEPKPAPEQKAEPEQKEEVKAETQSEVKPKPAIAKPLNKRPKEVSNGINKQGK